jgi:F-box and WD-40 domain protein 1/11
MQAVAAAGAGGQQQQGNAGNAATGLTAAQNGLAVAQHANAILQQQQQAPNGQGAAAALALGAQLAQLGTAMQQIPNPANINQAGQALAATHNAAPAPANQNAAQGALAPQPLQGAAAGPNPHAHAAAQGRNQSDSMRVFKLQFDTRRIICCSQNKVIVGWDFADGDKALEIVGSLSSETA